MLRPLPIVMTALLLMPASGALAQAQDPDVLYSQRENLQAAARAADLWEAHASTEFAAAWKLSRICYWLGTHGSRDARRQALNRGIKAGETAVRLSPNRPEGHFWLAANMGELAEIGGFTQGLKYKGRIKEELERTIAINPTWEQGSAEAALGRWYAKVPGMFGGDDTRAEQHLRRAIAINPESRNAMFDLAELQIDKGRKDEARSLLKKVISLPIDPDWAPEDRELSAQAAATLKKIDK